MINMAEYSMKSSIQFNNFIRNKIKNIFFFKFYRELELI